MHNSTTPSRRSASKTWLLGRTDQHAWTHGMPPPLFELTDQHQHGQLHRLGESARRWLLLYLNPKDDTPVTTVEACRLCDDESHLRGRRATLLRVILGNPRGHARFTARQNLPHALLADVDGATACAYGSHFALDPPHYAHRHSLLIYPQGRIARIDRKVTPLHRCAQVIDDSKSLSTGNRV